jgi:hypothetical protein
VTWVTTSVAGQSDTPEGQEVSVAVRELNTGDTETTGLPVERKGFSGLAVPVAEADPVIGQTVVETKRKWFWQRLGSL